MGSKKKHFTWVFRVVISIIAVIVNKNHRWALRFIEFFLCLTSHLCTITSNTNQTVIWETIFHSNSVFGYWHSNKQGT